MTNTRTYKVLPSKGAQGDVPGHEIIAHDYEWLGSPIKQVVFKRWDDVASMMIEVHIHWTEWTKYLKASWPSGGSVEAVILNNGRRIYASSRSCGHTDNDAYLAAPILCRDTFAIVTLQSAYSLLEVAGVRKWLYSKRDDAATAEFLACPWERDNRAFNEQMEAHRALRQPGDTQQASDAAIVRALLIAQN